MCLRLLLQIWNVLEACQEISSASEKLFPGSSRDYHSHGPLSTARHATYHTTFMDLTLPTSGLTTVTFKAWSKFNKSFLITFLWLQIAILHLAWVEEGDRMTNPCLTASSDYIHTDWQMRSLNLSLAFDGSCLIPALTMDQNSSLGFRNGEKGGRYMHW
jgi:hypothetical protein